MAGHTRWYTLNEDPLFSQPWTGGWNSTPASATSLEALHPFKDGGTTGTSARAEAVSTNPLRVGLTRWVTKGLKAQTISGTVDMCIGVLESNADSEFFTALNIYVSEGDTGNIRGTLLSNYGESTGAGGTEWPTTSTGYALASAQTLSSVSAQAGDRLVIEFGYVSRNSHTTSRTGTVRKGVMGSGVTELADLTVGSTSTSTSAGFFDFSNAIELLDPPDNDEWANATEITGDLTESYSIRMAERDGDEPASSCLGAVQPTGRHSSVWYVWTPATDQTGVDVTATLVDGLSDFNLGLHIFTGSPGSFVEVGCSVASTATEESITFDATAGVQYTFLISTQFWEGGDLTFEFVQGIAGTPAASAYGPDVDVFVTISEFPRTGAWDGIWLFGRIAITSNGGVLQENDDTNTYNGYSALFTDSGSGLVDVFLYRSTGANSSDMTNGVLLGTYANLPVANGEKFGLRCYGSSIEVYHFTSTGSSPTASSWVQIISASDAAYSVAGYAGFFVAGNFLDTNTADPGYYDDFGVGTVASGQSPAPAFPQASVVDDFNRGNAGTLGTHWQGFVSLGGQASMAGIFSTRATNTAFAAPRLGWGYLYATSVAPSGGSGTSAPQLLKFGLHHPIPNPPSYEDGFISGKLRQISSISHSLSTMDGDPVGMSIEIDVDDQDRETRIALDTLGTRYLDGLEGVCKFVSEGRRVQRLAPSVVGRGYMKGYGLVRKRKAQFSVEDQLTSEYGPLSSRRLISDRKLTQSLFAGIPPQVAGTGQRMIIGLVGDWGAVTPGTGAPAEKGLIPVYTVGARNIYGQDYIELFVCGHACESIDVYGSDAAGMNRVAINPAEYGSVVLAPGKTGWPFATNKYLDYTDTATGRVHRVTTFFVLASDIKAISHLSNGVSLAVNACGMEDRGDGEGNVITGLFHAWQHVWDNWIAPNVGYHSGLYAGAPTFADGTSKTDSASFFAAQTLTQQWIGGEGYTAGCIFQDVLAIDVMRQFARTSHANWGTRLSGQMMVSLPDHTATLSGLPVLKAPVDVRAGIAPKYVSGTIQNPLTYVYDYDPDTGKYRTDARQIRDQIAIGYTGDLERPAAIELYCTRDENTAVSSAGNRLLWRKYPLQEVEWPMGKEGLNHNIGDIVRVTSEDGPGSLGFVEAPIRIMKRTFYPKTQSVVMEGLVMDNHLLIPAVLTQTTGAPVAPILTQTGGAPVPPVYTT